MRTKELQTLSAGEIIVAVNTECQSRIDEVESAAAQVERDESARVTEAEERVAAARDTGSAAELREAKADLSATKEQAESRSAKAQRKCDGVLAWRHNKRREGLEKGFGKARWLALVGRAVQRDIDEAHDAAALLDADRQVAEIRAEYGIDLHLPSEIVRQGRAQQVVEYFENHRVWAAHALALQSIETAVAEERETVLREWQARLDAHTMPAPLPQIVTLLERNERSRDEIPERYREAYEGWQGEHAALEQQRDAAAAGVTAESLGLEIPAEPDCPRPEGNLAVWAQVLGIEIEPPVPAHRRAQRQEQAWAALVERARAAASEVRDTYPQRGSTPVQMGTPAWAERERREQVAYDRVIREGLAAGVTSPPPPPVAAISRNPDTVVHALGVPLAWHA